MKLRLFFLLLCCAFGLGCSAQSLHLDTASFTALNQRRIASNTRGMLVLGAWSAANIAVGTAGYFIAKNDEWKAFHGMNAGWNLVNLLIAVPGYLGAQREASATFSCSEMLHRYESNKRLYLLNGGLDLLYIGTGTYLIQRSRSEANSDVWLGFGKSVVLQGAFLLAFDGIMFASHQSQDKKWYKLLQGICVTANGIGYRHAFN